MTENEGETQHKPSFKHKITGLGQTIIGEIETIGGVLTGDPNTQAEGEFNVEVGSVREELESVIEKEKDEEEES